MFHLHFHRKLKLKKTTELALIRLIFAIGFAGVDTIWSLYLNSYGLQESIIGFISAIFVILTLAFSFFSTIILEKWDEYSIFITSMIILIASYIAIFFTKSLNIFLLLAGIVTIIQIIRINAFDILFRDESKTKELNENEGLLYALSNIGWLLGPLVAGFVMFSHSISAVFLSSSVFLIISTILFLKLKIKPKQKKKESIDRNILQNLKDFFISKKRNLAYLIAAGIEVWYALIYIYVPLFIIKNGLGGDIVGFFLAAIIIPLILFEFEVGKWANKIGFRKFFFVGFSLLSIAAIFSYFSTNIYTTLFILVLASIPMSFLEPLQDSYFFKSIQRKDEEKYYPIFATAADFGSFIGKFTIAFMLLFFSDNIAYITIAVLMAIIALITFKVKD